MVQVQALCSTTFMAVMDGFGQNGKLRCRSHRKSFAGYKAALLVDALAKARRKSSQKKHFVVCLVIDEVEGKKTPHF